MSSLTSQARGHSWHLPGGTVPDRLTTSPGQRDSPDRDSEHPPCGARQKEAAPVTTTPPAQLAASSRTEAMRKGRQADSARRRQRVINSVNRALADGAQITVSGIARAAAVDRAFIYRHRDLLGQIHGLQAAPPGGGTTGPAVTCVSLQADLLAAHERSVRLAARVRQLEKRLSETLGEQAWRESGLGEPADIDALRQEATHLQQHAIDLRLQLDEREQDLAAARAANRELMAQLNAPARHR